MGRTSNARERLIEAGKSLIGSRGYTAVGVSELCDEAAVRKGSFYYFFPSKSELAVAVVNSFWVDFESGLESALDQPGSPMERIDRFLDRISLRHRKTCDRKGTVEGCLLGNLALELSTTDEEVRETLVRVFDRFSSRLAVTIAEAMDEGELPSDDAERLGKELVAYVEGMILVAKTKNDPNVIVQLRGGALALLGADRPCSRKRTRSRRKR